MAPAERKDPSPHAAPGGGPGPAEIGPIVELFNAGRPAQAEDQAHRLTERYPDSGIAWDILAASLRMQGKDALAAMQRAARLLPNQPEVQHNLGCALHDHGQLDAAMASYRRALEINPGLVDAHINLGVILHAQGRLDAAAASYRRALEINPALAEVHSTLGNTLRDAGQLEDAVQSHRRALAIAPDFAEAHYNLGLALQDLGQHEEAVQSYRRALAIKPAYAAAHADLGVALHALGKFEEAAASYRRALDIAPGLADALDSLGVTLQELGQIDAAVASHERALEIKPDYEDAFSNLLFVLNYHPDRSAEEIFAAYREYERRFALPQRGSWREHANSRERARRLKIGYVSPDFRQHSARHVVEPLLSHHDKGVVEVFAYAELQREDAVTARYRNYVDHWIPTRGLSDAAMAERIRADRIDVLVDLAGHTAHNRLRVFAHKPAPVSVSWMGYGYTTGLAAVDYYLTDAVFAPEGCEALFAETLWRLPVPAFLYRPDPETGAVSALPALERGHVTFGTLTRSIRINYRTLRVWSEILRRIDGARLVVDSSSFRDARAQAALYEKFAALGVDRARVDIGFHSPAWKVLRGLDISLDCFPHNSGTTLLESLHMGVPYLTLAGRPSVGRLGSSLLQGIGHAEWIARTEEEYVEKAVELAGDLPRLVELRAGLRAQMEACPLMDEAGFARRMEEAYREMFDRWAQS